MGCTNFASIANLAANTVNYYDKSVNGATTYRYRVAATSSSGQSELFEYCGGYYSLRRMNDET